MDNTVHDQFQISVKGLFFNTGGKLLMVKESTGVWELPGGRMNKEEQFVECLKRECMEEMGLECNILEDKPTFAYPTIDRMGRNRVMIFYKMELPSLDFTPSSECVEVKFFAKEEIAQLKLHPQMKRLTEFI